MDPDEAPWQTINRQPSGQAVDVGPDVLSGLRAALMIDEKWMLAAPRALTWWSWRLAQRIVISEPGVVLGDPTVTVGIETDVVEQVDADDEGVYAVLNRLNIKSALNAFVFWPETRRVSIACSAAMHQGNRGLDRTLGLAAILQNIEAHKYSDDLAEQLNGTPSVTSHPASGERPEPDDMLNVVDAVAARGEGASQFDPAEFGQLAADDDFGWLLASSDGVGMTGELPFDSEIPASLSAMFPHLEGPAGGTALFEADAGIRHPVYGSGVQLLLSLPRNWETAAEIAAGLNLAETAGPIGFPMLGAWCAHPSVPTRVCFTTFLPSMSACPGLITTFARYSGWRIVWAYHQLGPSA